MILEGTDPDDTTAQVEPGDILILNSGETAGDPVSIVGDVVYSALTPGATPCETP